MPNYQPSHIYTPLYGTRYMGNNRAPAPAVGGAGSVDQSVMASRNAVIGVPYQPQTEDTGNANDALSFGGSLNYSGVPNIAGEMGTAVGWSGTGRDQSAVENLSTYGFRDLVSSDPFGSGYDFSAPIISNPPSITEPPPEETPISFYNDGGDSQSLYQEESLYGPSSYEGEFDITNPMDIAWGLYNIGADLPAWAKPLTPGVMALETIGANMLDQEIDKIGKSFDKLDTVSGVQSVVTDDKGNIALQYDPNVKSIGSLSNLDAKSYSSLVNQYGAENLSLDSTGNVNVTKPDGTVARAGYNPYTGQVNTYNFNVNPSVVTNSNINRASATKNEAGKVTKVTVAPKPAPTPPKPASGPAPTTVTASGQPSSGWSEGENAFGGNDSSTVSTGGDTSFDTTTWSDVENDPSWGGGSDSGSDSGSSAATASDNDYSDYSGYMSIGGKVPPIMATPQKPAFNPYQDPFEGYF